jgi:hypothetical protein
LQIEQNDESEEATVSTEKAYTSLDLREFEIIKNDKGNMNMFTYTNNFLPKNQDFLRRIHKSSHRKQEFSPVLKKPKAEGSRTAVPKEVRNLKRAKSHQGGAKKPGLSKIHIYNRGGGT